MSTAASQLPNPRPADITDKAELRRASAEQTGKLTFEPSVHKLIDSLVRVGGYESAEQFCEQAAIREAQRQHEEYKKLRGNMARRKG